jgi:serine/threonine-protein kinase
MTPLPPQVTAALADRYRVARELGAGGMATVYLAEDLKHHRRIALKVLRPELAAILGAERFLKEIEVTANLQHPNILPLYDSGEAAGFLYYVMPFVEGESLRARLAREQQLPIEEALRIADAVAAALQFAHEHGVVHRDIKPENILLQSGQALVADFGIALAVSHAGGTRLTETGLSLGTPHYMSPEQAAGDRVIDARSDVYALGSVLYEMLVGEPPHLGNSAQAVVAKILTEDPVPARLRRRTVPAHVDAGVQRALARLPADRFASAADLRRALGDPTATVALPAGRRPRPRRLPMLLGLGVAAVAALGAGRLLLGRPATGTAKPQVVRFDIAPPDSGGVLQRPDVSPDGSRILLEERAADGSIRLFIRDIATLGTSRLQLPDPEPRWAFFSPDSRELAFVSTTRLNSYLGKLRVAPLGGGPVRTLADSAIAKSGWGDDGYIYYSALPRASARARLVRVPNQGGVADTVLASDSFAFYVPTPLPGSRALLMIANELVNDEERLSAAVLDLRTRRWRTLARSGLWISYLAPGYVLFDRGRTLMGARFDPDRLELVGDPVPLIEVAAPQFGAFNARGGTLAYLSGLQFWYNRPVLMDRRGRRRPLANLPGPHEFGSPAAAPDGRRIALRITPPSGGPRGSDIWVYQLPRGPLTRLTFQGADDVPTWTPDGKRIVYDSDRDGGNALWWTAADGGGGAARILDRPEILWRASWLPDGRRFVFTAQGSTGQGDVGIATVGDSAGDRMLLSGPYDESAAAVSRDGRWFAYQSDESGRKEIYLRPFEGHGTRHQVSQGGGTYPVWSWSGRELYFQSATGDSLFAARLDTPGDGGVQDVTALFPMPQADRGFDVLPGDSLFVLTEPAGPEGPNQAMVVVTDFTAELEARLGAGASR